MRVLADENVPGAVVQALRAQGHDVVWIADDLASTADPDVLALRVVTVLESRDDWAGHFSVVEPGRTRMRRLPSAGEARDDVGAT